jgi:hypothetical protein
MADKVKDAYRNPVLDILDEKIEELEKRLEKVQPYVDELNRLRDTRRVLLSEKGVTSGRGGGSAGPQLSMEEVVRFLQENGPSGAQASADGVGFDAHRVRSHLSRNKGIRYSNPSNGVWELLEEGEDNEEEK